MSTLEEYFTANKSQWRQPEQLQDLAVLFDKTTRDLLSKNGIHATTEILRMPRRDFLKRMGPALGDVNKADQLYIEATVRQAQTRRRTAEEMLGHGKDLLDTGLLRHFEKFLRCEPIVDSILSPLAYFADLLAYAVNHVTKSGAKLSVAELESMLHQPLQEIFPASERAKASVTQVRACIEILREYTGKRPLQGYATDGSGHTRERVLSDAESQYGLAVYTALLKSMGISYDDLRLARFADQKKRARIAGLLGIDLSDREDRLASLLLRPDQPSGDLHALTEAHLEQIFGIEDSTRGPLEEREEPNLLTWKLEHQRTVWEQEDWPQNDYSKGLLPVIDPDLVGPDDMRNPGPGDPVFDLWLVRRNWLDERLGELRAKTVTVHDREVPDVDGLLVAPLAEFTYNTQNASPWPSSAVASDLRLRYDALLSGTDPDVRDYIFQQLHLLPTAFARLWEIGIKHRQWKSDERKPQVSADEYTEMLDILLGAIKRAFYPNWVKEEKARDSCLLGPRYFWTAIREPENGKWPPERASGAPWIDPDLVADSAMPDSQVRLKAHDLLLRRQKALAGFCGELQLARQSRGLESAFSYVWGTPGPKRPAWSALIDLLNSALLDPDEAKAARARQSLTDQLGLTEDEFKFLCTVKAKATLNDPSKLPSDEEWKQLYKILTHIYKVRTLYPKWRNEEDAQHIQYWNVLRLQLARWRADADSRSGWQESFRQSSRTPNLDPDLVVEADLQGPAAALRHTHSDEVTVISNRFGRALDFEQKAGEQPSHQFETVLRLSSIGLTSQGLRELSQQRKQGANIGWRLRQLLLTDSAFRELSRLLALAESEEPLLASESDSLVAILTQIEKQLRYPVWNAQEAAKGYSVSPDHFVLATLDGGPVTPPKLLPWRANWDDRRNLLDTIQTRIDQRSLLIQDYADLLQKVDAAAAPILRDGLVRASNAPKASFSDRARWLSERLLIETESTGEQVTTRLEQAVTTLQQLLWGLRTGQLCDKYEDSSLKAPDFDKQWKWIGTYGNWRAAMGVFIHPENVLLPELRADQSNVFRSLVENNQTLSVANAGRAVSQYIDYFRDICAITLEASASVHVADRWEVYGFGRSLVSHKIYWSKRTMGDHSQSPWNSIECFGTTIVQLVGAFVARNLLLVGFAEESGKRMLVAAEFDLETQRWSDEYSVLEAPKEENSENGSSQPNIDKAEVTFDYLSVTPLLLLTTTGGNKPNVRRLAYLTSDKQLRWTTTRESTYIGRPSCGWVFLPDYRPTAFPVQGRDTKLIAADVDGDGRDELITVSNKVSVWKYDPKFDGLWAETANWLNSSDFLLCGDFDGDGMSEIATYDNASFVIHKRNQDGSWNVTSQFRREAHQAWAADFDGDGRDEIAVECKPSSAVVIIDFDTASKAWKAIAGEIPSQGQGIRFLLNLKRKGHAARQLIAAFLDTDAEDRSAFTWVQTAGVNPKTPTLELEGKFRIGPVPFDASNRSSSFATAGDIDGDGSDELAIVTPAGNYLVYNSSLEQTHTFDPGAPGIDKTVQFLASGDFDGDGRDEIVIVRQSSPKSIWLMDFDPVTGRWHNLTPICTEPARPDLDIRTIGLEPRCPVAGRFDGDVLVCLAVPLFASINQDYMAPEEIMVTKLAVVPVNYSGPTNLVAFSPGSGFTSRQELTVSVHTLADRPTQAAIAEAFYFLPLQIALLLQRDGDYIAALDWFRRVYDYTLPEAFRYNYAGISPRMTPIDYFRQIDWLRSIDPHHVANSRPNAYLQFTLLCLIRCLLDYADAEFTRDISESVARADALYCNALELLDNDALIAKEDSSAVIKIDIDEYTQWNFVVPENPIPDGLRLHANLNIFKLHSGRNIAGMKRQMEAFSEGSDIASGLIMPGSDGAGPEAASNLNPTPYRFKFLIDRAQYLATLAGQTESSMLAALEKFDTETYMALKAQQDVETARAGEQVQDWLYTEANDSVALAQLQIERANIQLSCYDAWINGGLNEFERQMLDAYESAATVKHFLLIGQTGYGLLATTASASLSGQAALPGLGLLAMANLMLESVLVDYEKTSQIASMHAAFARRVDEWTLQKQLAQQDVTIGEKQRTIASDHLQVVIEQQHVAQLETEHSEAVATFLGNKFTSKALYRWMSGTLERVYKGLLQDATATARLAQQQLAFERAETPQSFIKSDYYQGTSGSSDERKGLTGSARLLQDISELQQYALKSEKRKLQVTKAISLAQFFPFELQNFRKTGTMDFRTSMLLFDCDFPGHYLRLIKRVRLTLIALVPPTEGIKATLTSSGVSRVIVANDGVFQRIPLRRLPELIALSSPVNASGIFEFENQGEVLLPFESSGVDMLWQLCMPKAANRFDYDSIADIILTIDYTALDSPDYRQQVLQEIGDNVLVDKAISFRNDLADQWYDLHNPDQSPTPMTVGFELEIGQFPRNLENLRIRTASLFFVQESDGFPAGYTARLQLADSAGTKKEAEIALGTVTRCSSIGGHSPIGRWEMSFPNAAEIRDLFRLDQVEDLILQITYSARRPTWPV